MKRLFSYNGRMAKSRLGQATTELAVMGILILVVFGTLLRYAQMMNAQQELKMYTHRRTLELAKVRRDSGKYGAVSLVAMKEVFPVNMFSSEREPTYMSASSGVSMHEETLFYEDFDVDRTEPEHVGATFYQIGAGMINNNTVLVMPSILVKRSVDEDDAPTTPWDADVKWLKEVATFGQTGNDPEDYVSLEPAPIADMNQFIRTVSSNEYARSETSTDSSYNENNTLNIEQTMTYKFMDEETLKEWNEDDDAFDVIGDIPEDVVIRTIKTIEQEREWATPN